jgi:methionyl-tRNA formyltransferase
MIGHMRIIFMGSPDFAIPTLRALAQNYLLVGVVTQPDRASGRGRTLTPSPIKRVAQEMGLPIIQPERLRQPEAIAQLQEWKPDLIVVAAFGQILRSAVLNLPHYGCVNVHASLLPRWRGAAPIQAALLNGDTQTGITIMQMDAGMDTGPILSQSVLSILPGENAGKLNERLSTLGAELLIDTLPSYLNGNLRPQPQDDSGVTYAPMLKKEDGKLDLQQTAETLQRSVLAYNPWPGTYISWQGQPFKILSAHTVEDIDAQPGETTIYRGLPALGTGQGLLVLDVVQPAGKKPMPGKAFLQGAKEWNTSA